MTTGITFTHTPTKFITQLAQDPSLGHKEVRALAGTCRFTREIITQDALLLKGLFKKHHPHTAPSQAKEAHILWEAYVHSSQLAFNLPFDPWSLLPSNTPPLLFSSFLNTNDESYWHRDRREFASEVSVQGVPPVSPQLRFWV